MANMCSNTIYFCSTNKEVLQRFMDTVQDGDSYQELFRKNGYTEEEARKNTDGRDYITYCDYEIEERDDFYCFRIDSETSWDCHIETFHLRKQKFCPEVLRLFSHIFSQFCAACLFHTRIIYNFVGNGNLSAKTLLLYNHHTIFCSCQI